MKRALVSSSSTNKNQNNFGNSQKIVRRNGGPPRKKVSYPSHVSTSIPELHGELYRQIFDLILTRGTFFNSQNARQNGPFCPPSSKQIQELMAQNPLFPSGSGADAGVGHDRLVQFVEKLIEASPHASHPYFLNREGTGLDPYGLIADWLGTALSAIVIIYSVSPVFHLMEYEVERRIRQLIRYPDEGRQGDGMFPPGGGAGNGYAIQLALQAKFPALKNNGILHPSIKSPVLFVSEHGHTASIEAYCIWQGIGTKACVKVQVDQDGRMDILDLRKKIQEAQNLGRTPFMIVATAGSPILGAIDSLQEVADVAEKFGLWMHVDGQLAGGHIFSKNQAHRLQGVQYSDSFLWSAHKGGFCAPAVTTILVTRQSNALKKAFCYGAPYVFSPSTLYDNGKWDKGDNTLQCTRRPDALKLWFMLKVKGQNLIEAHIDHTFEVTQYAFSLLKKRPDVFTTICQNFDSPLLFFYFVPKILRNFSKFMVQAKLIESKFTQKLRTRLLAQGIMSLSVETLPMETKDGVPVPFFVMNLGNSALQKSDIDYLLEAIEFCGEEEAEVSISLTNLEVEENLESDDKIFESLINNFPLQLKKPPQIPLPPPPPATFEKYVSAPVESVHGKLLQKFVQFLLTDLTYWENERRDGGEPPQRFRTPEQLLEEFDFDLSKAKEPKEMEEIFKICKSINRYSVHFSHPYFNYTLSQGLDPYTLMADYVIGAISQPSAILTKMESEVTAQVRRLVGYDLQDGDDGGAGGNGDGVVVPGGSAAIQIALALAVTSKFPKIIEHGHAPSVLKKQLVAYVSSAGHWATAKGAFFGGVGLDNCVQIEVAGDGSGRMCPKKFRRAVQKSVREGKCPFFVTVTSGTTVMGAFDDLEEISDVCQEFGIWLHCDASYGGTTLFSQNERLKWNRFRGVERSDSFNMNAHKVLGAVREASVLVTRRQGMLASLDPPTSTTASCTNHDDCDENGDVSMRQSLKYLFPDRRQNAFKLWFLFQAKGLEGLGRHVDQGYALTRKVLKYLVERQDAFYMGHPFVPPQSPHVNFYYVPKSMRQMDRRSKEFSRKIDLVTHEIIRKMNLDGRVVLATKKPASDVPSYLVLACAHSAMSFEDALYMLKLVEFYGHDL